MHFRHAALSDVGIKRAQNEDSYLVNADLGLFVVADGMGGHAGGETASRVAVATIEQEMAAARQRAAAAFEAPGALETTPLADVVREVLEAACGAVYHAGKADPELDGMGTTSIALLVHGGYALAGHVGDSRLYIVRGEHIQQLSEDHSLVNEQVKAGLLTPDQARVSRFKNIITRSVGFEEDVLVDVFGVRLEAGDKLLLCSDGLSNMVDDEELRDTLRQVPTDRVPQTLVDLANARGGDDNITVIAIEILDPSSVRQ
jgi:serine/threonine protein phosphatase PrpC